MKKTNTKRALLSSAISLLLCFAMLLGTTFAWFTDSVSSGVNTIKAGNLDIDVLHTSASVATAETIANETELFRDANGGAMLWEPGAVSYEIFTVKNLGTLALKYKLAMNILDYNAVSDTSNTLKDVLKVKVLSGNDMLTTVTRDSVMALDWSTNDTLDVFNTAGALQPKGTDTDADTFQVIVYWAPGASDNDYNVNNGKTTTDGQPLFINFGINVVASQLASESDSFDNQYDQGIALPDLPVSVNKVFQSAPIAGNSVTESVTVKNVSTNTGVATVQAASVNAVIDALTAQAADKAADSDLSTVIYLDVQTADKTETSVTYEIGMSATLTYTDTNGNTQTTTLDELNGHLDDKIVTATMEVGKGLSNVTVKHHDTPMTQLASVDEDAEGYYYNKTTGVLTIKSKSFSPFTVDYTIEGVAAIGNEVYATLEDAIAASDAGDTVVLLKDIIFAHNKGYVITVKSNTVIDLNGKTITVPFMSAIFQGANFTIKNGNFSSDASYALWIGDEGTTDSVVIEDVTVNGGINVYNATNVTLRNVTADATGHTYYAVWADENAHISIESGKYIGASDKVAVLSYNGANGGEPGEITITGGSFSTNPAEYAAPGYKVAQDGEYFVVSLCAEHVYVDGVCTACGKTEETWLAIENAMTEAPEGYSAIGNAVSISTNYGLAWFAKQVNAGNNFANYTVTLTADIDLLDYPWTPINGFTGTFDGGNHTIANLYFHSTATDGQGFGLFGQSNGQVKNLTINNAHVMGNAACGAFVGTGSNGLLENLHLTGSIVIGTTTNQGHLANFNSSYIGGIIGYSFLGKIKNCTVTGDENSVIGGGRQVGGILGFGSYGYTDSVVGCSVNNIKVLGTKSVGGIVGWANSTGIQNCGITNVCVELTSASEPNTIGLISGTSRCLLNDSETTVYENNTADTASKLIVNGETPSFDSDPVLRLYSPYSSASYVTLAEGKYMFTCYGITKAMDKGDHITLLASSSEQVTIPAGRTITIDLNGYSHTNSITNSGNATIQNGKVVGTITNNGALTIRNATVFGTVSGNEPTLDNATIVESAAKVGSKYFATVQDALNYAAETTGAKHLYLMENCDETLTIPVSPNIYIYDQGYSLAGDITNNGTLAFRDSEGIHSATILNNGTLELSQKQNSGLTVINNGTVKITSGGTYDLSKITNGENGNVIIDGGTFNTEPQSDWIAAWYTAAANEDGTYTVRLMNDEEAIAAGAVVRYNIATSSNRKYFKTLQEGLQNGSVHLLKDATGSVTKDGTIDLYCENYTFTGSILCPRQTLYINNGTAVLDRIECGTFYGGDSYYKANVTVKDGTATKIIVAKNATVVIEGGKYTGTITVNSGASLTITGGTFTVDPSAYVPETHQATKNADGTWTVTARAT